MPHPVRLGGTARTARTTRRRAVRPHVRSEGIVERHPLLPPYHTSFTMKAIHTILALALVVVFALTSLNLVIGLSTIELEPRRDGKCCFTDGTCTFFPGKTNCSVYEECDTQQC